MNKRGLAVITGASQGIGATIAAGLAKDGYRVVMIARNKEKLEKVCSNILEMKGDIQNPILLPIDITDYDQLNDELIKINGEHGPIEILVNSAAMFIDGSLEESIDRYKEIINTNLVAQYAILKVIVEIMKNQRSGYIFNIASRAGKYGFSGGGIYGSTKFALVGLTESLYRELSPLGIRITSLCPGWVNTQMAKECGTPFQDDEMVQPSDLLNTIRYLLGLSENVCIKEIVLEMKKSII